MSAEKSTEFLNTLYAKLLIACRVPTPRFGKVTSFYAIAERRARWKTRRESGDWSYLR